MKQTSSIARICKNILCSSLRQQSKKFKYKDLAKAKVIADSELPRAQQGKVVFTVKHEATEVFQVKGMDMKQVWSNLLFTSSLIPRLYQEPSCFLQEI